MSHPPGLCPVCNKPFTDADDVVICPDCGAPYHRACYQERGSCVFADKHASGFEYAPPAAGPVAAGGDGPAGSNGKSQGAGGILCKSCGTVNEASGIFCENCGAPLHEEYAAHAGQNADSTGPPPTVYSGGGGQRFGGAYGPADQGQAVASEIDGIPAKDWAAYIGPSAPTYLARFSAQQLRGTKVGFMLSAFLFSSLYFAYRKLWRWAALAAATYLLLLVPNVLWILSEVDFPLVAGLSTDMLYSISVVCSYLSLARQIVFGLFALLLYRRQGVKRIQALRAGNPDEAGYQAALVKAGGISWLGVALVCVVFVALYMVLYYYAGEALLAYYMTLL